MWKSGFEPGRKRISDFHSLWKKETPMWKTRRPAGRFPHFHIPVPQHFHRHFHKISTGARGRDWTHPGGVLTHSEDERRSWRMPWRSCWRRASEWRPSSIFRIAYMTVVWCLPPKAWPISLREASKWCRARYMAI